MRVAVIGTGFGERLVAKVYRDVGFEVDVISPRDSARIREACRASYDLISIHSPPFLHHDHVMLALGHGRNILCDKPFGMSEIEAREMVQQAERAGILHFVNFEFRQDPARLKLREIIDAGMLGSPQHVSWRMFTSASRTPLAPFGWLFDRELGGGWINAYGSHLLDCLMWLFGDLVTASGVARTDIAVRPDREGRDQMCSAEDGFSACLRFSGGITAAIDTGFAAHENCPQEIEIIGSEGTAVLTGTTNLVIRRVDGSTEHHSFPPHIGDVHEPSFRRWAAMVKDSLETGRQIRPSFHEGYACAAALQWLRDTCR